MAEGKGHNSLAKGQLRAYAERIERLEEEQAALGRDKAEVYAEMRGNGYDVKAMKAAIQARRMDRAEFTERRAILDLYLNALGLIGGEGD
ncbi:DUF2312 domain-containing protein [Pyruvatibacter sp.]|uniref:DUF2312 domain-containing protein n=1 Tax=Pyruvatibacter sp. TaxID=1981328 RepID=UPI0032F04FEA